MPHSGPTTASPTIRRLLRALVALASLLGALAVADLTDVTEPATTADAAAGPTDNDWLGIVNTYRAQSGLSPVTANASWSAGARAHSCWMLLNGIAHDERPGTPGYSTAGDQAGNAGNVAVSTNASTTARKHIDLWMSGPFHAIGILRPSLRSSGFGSCASPPNPSTTAWKSGGTLDVIRGNDWSAPSPPSPVVFPGNGATTSLTRFVAETPDPRSFCGWSGRTVGLPLIALMPRNTTSASATLRGPNGPVGTCVLTESNTNGVARSILGGDDAVVVVPAAPLTTGRYTVSVNSNGGSANWSFDVDPNAPLTVDVPPPPSTKLLNEDDRFVSVTPFRFADSRRNQAIGTLPANRQVRLRVAGRPGLPNDMTALSANFTVVNARGRGHLTVSDCSESRPSVSTLNYGAYQAVPNQALVSLDGDHICLFSTQRADIVIDVNGYASPSGDHLFTAVKPKRLLDSRKSTTLRPGQVRRLDVEGGSSPAPDAAVAVALNVTGVNAPTRGWIKAFPCGVPEPSASTLNPMPGTARANSAIVPTAADGTICLTSNMRTDVVVDITGWFGPSGSADYTALSSIRLADTRRYDSTLNPLTRGMALKAGQVLKVKVAGVRGIPGDVVGATVNVAAVGAKNRGWLRLTPCGTSSNVSTLNMAGPPAIANGANVKLGPGGDICVVAVTSTHVIVDVTGVWR